MNAVPHYVTVDDQQVRVWRAGSGPSLVVLPGLAVGAAVTAAQLARIGWTVSAIELSTAAAGTHSLYDVGHRIAATIEALGLAQ
jgi:hypothetical protein